MPFHASLAQLMAVLAIDPATVTATSREQEATGISTDSRTLQAGDVFLALRGENFDGHQFLATAIERGAIAVIVAADAAVPAGPVPLLRVPDTLAAYQAIARWWRAQFSIPVIGVTGSVGKTTTKELITAVLSLQGKVLKSQANFNNEIGVPKTLLELDESHQYAVIEMAMRGPHEIALLCQIACPTIGVITNVGTAHIGRLGSEAAIARAKCELLAEMPDTSTAILNHDNPLLIKTAASVWEGPTLTYGLNGGDLRGELVDLTTLRVGELEFPLPLPGRHNALNYLAALAVARVLEVDWSPLADGLTVDLPAGRARRYELAEDVLVLDETYNAGLESMLAALRLLAETPGARRIAILGTMKELGDRSPEFHGRVGQAVRDLKLDHLLILADAAEAAALAAGAAPVPAEQCTDHAMVVQRLKALVQPGDRLLFKASRAVGLEKVVDQFRTDWMDAIAR